MTSAEHELANRTLLSSHQVSQKMTRSANVIWLQICDALEDQLNVGGNIVDFHSCDFFPERWFDLVIVLHTDNTILYDRLEKR